MLIQAASVNDNVVDVRISTQVERVQLRQQSPLAPNPGEVILNAKGAKLLPGLHDHHLHFRALAAASQSVACGPPAVTTQDQLVAALQSQPGSGWLRGVL